MVLKTIFQQQRTSAKRKSRNRRSSRKHDPRLLNQVLKAIGVIRLEAVQHGGDVEYQIKLGLVELFHSQHFLAAFKAASPKQKQALFNNDLVRPFLSPQAVAEDGQRITGQISLDGVFPHTGPTEAERVRMVSTDTVGVILDSSTEDRVQAADLAIRSTMDYISPQTSPPSQAELTAWIASENPQRVLAMVAQRVNDLESLGIERITAWAFGGLVGLRFDGSDFYRPALELVTSAAEAKMPNPLAPLVRGWLDRPRLVKPSDRTNGRIIPGRLGMVHSGDPQEGRLFSPAGHISHDGQTILPGFGSQDPKTPALPVELWDLGIAGTKHYYSHSAPLALRIFIESIVRVPQEHRNGQPVAMDTSLRSLLAALYPGPRNPRPTEYWERLMQAREELFRNLIPIFDPATGRMELRQLVHIGGIPSGADALDDNIRIIVDLPQGSENGPQISDRLNWYGARSYVKYRLLLNFAYLWFEPGRTHHPVGRGKHRHWVRNMNPKAYDRVTDDDLVLMAYPKTTTKSRKMLVLRARQAVHELAEDGEIQMIDSKILPPTPNA